VPKNKPAVVVPDPDLSDSTLEMTVRLSGTELVVTCVRQLPDGELERTTVAEGELANAGQRTALRNSLGHVLAAMASKLGYV
jgi:hypothetical protein